MQVVKTKIPVPEATEVKLVSEGILKPTFTTHHYYETRVLSEDEVGTEYEHIFECFKTGAKRRWGTAFVERPIATSSADPVVREPSSN